MEQYDTGVVAGQPEQQGIVPPDQGNANDTPIAGSDPNEQVQPQAPQPVQQQQWNPDEYSLNYRGQVIKPRDRQHLINLAQQGLSYSQSMEVLKRQQQDMQGRYGQYEQMEQLFKSRPDLGPKFAQLLMEQQQQPQQPQQQYQQQQYQGLPPEIMQKIEELDKFRGSVIEKQADSQLDNEIDTLKRKFNDQQWDMPDPDGKGTLLYRTMKHAFDNNFQSLESAFKDLMFDHYVTETKANALKSAKENRQQQTRAGIVTGGPQTNPQAPAAQPLQYNRGDTYDDALKKALASLK
jgi:hypothetical protein